MGGRAHDCPVCKRAGCDCVCYAVTATVGQALTSTVDPRNAEARAALPGLVRALEAELAEWRSGKRRVFWRVKWRHLFAGGHMTQDWGNRTEAKQHAAMSHDARVLRVTVGPAKKKEAG